MWSGNFVTKADSQLTKAMLVHGAKVNATDALGETALSWEIFNHKNTVIIKQLLDYGADPNASSYLKNLKLPDLIALLLHYSKHP